MKITVSAVVPACNEERKVGRTVSALLITGRIDEVIVVDDGSTDLTAASAAAAGARVLRLSRNRGKGEAMKRGADMAGGEILVFLDADLGDSAGEAVHLLDAVLSDRADMAVALFHDRVKGGGFGMVVGLARVAIHILTGLSMKQPLSGQRAMFRRVFDALGGCAPGFGAEVGLTIDAVRAGFRVVEVETGMMHQVTGRDIAGFRHRGKQFVHVVRAVAPRALGISKAPSRAVEGR